MHWANRLLGAAAALTFFGTTAEPVNAQTRSIACGQYYTVARGDTLRDLALRANGNDNFQVIYQLNRNVLLGPNQLEVGDRIFIPCTEGTEGRTKPVDDEASGPELARPQDTVRVFRARDPANATQRTSVTKPEETQSSPAQSEPRQPQETGRTIRFLTSDGNRPYTGKNLPQGGVFTELVRQAMARSAGSQPYRVSFVNDRKAHLDVLLPEGMFDLSFPWTKPDCAAAEAQTGNVADQCRDYDFSDPVIEVTAKVYALAEESRGVVRSREDLKGKTMCVTQGDAMAMPNPSSVTTSVLAILTAPDATACFDLLIRGSVDVVRQNSLVAASAIARLELDGEVTEVSALAETQTLHVIAPKSNPDGRALLDVLNLGLKDLRETGGWFKLVSDHLSRHARTYQ